MKRVLAILSLFALAAPLWSQPTATVLFKEQVDTEAELEGVLSDASDVITNNDSAGGDLSGSFPSPTVAANTLDFLNIDFSLTLAGNPALAVDECYFAVTAGGGGFICEGSAADTSEQLYLFPDLNGVDTTDTIVAETATQTLTNKSISGDQIDSGTVPAARVGADHIDAASEIADNIIGSAEMDLTAAFAWTGDHDFGGGGIEIENGTTPPSCTVGQIYLDTDATAGQQLMACEGGTFVLQGDGTGGGAFSDSADPIVQNTTGKDVHVGDGAGTLTGKLEIGGDADQPQLVVEGHSTQTADLVVVQDDADTELVSIDSAGAMTITRATDGGQTTLLTLDDDGGASDGARLLLTKGASGTAVLEIGQNIFQLYVDGGETAVFKTFSGGHLMSFRPGNNEALRILSTASSVNYATVGGATTGNGPTIAPAGSDTDIDLVLSGKGTGIVDLTAGITLASGEIESADIAADTIVADDVDTSLDTRATQFSWQSPADTDEFVVKLPPVTGTMTRVDCETVGATSITINICDGEDVGDDTCATSIFDATASTTLTCTDAGASDTSLNATGFVARDDLTIVVTAVSGSPTQAIVYITSTVD